MIDYHKPMNNTTATIGINVYLHDSGMVGKVLEVGDGMLLLEVEDSYAHAIGYKPLGWWVMDAAIHTCESGAESPKPTRVHRYLLEYEVTK